MVKVPVLRPFARHDPLPNVQNEQILGGAGYHGAATAPALCSSDRYAANFGYFVVREYRAINVRAFEKIHVITLIR